MVIFKIEMKICGKALSLVIWLSSTPKGPTKLYMSCHICHVLLLKLKGCKLVSWFIYLYVQTIVSGTYKCKWLGSLRCWRFRNAYSLKLWLFFPECSTMHICWSLECWKTGLKIEICQSTKLWIFVRWRHSWNQSTAI